MPSSREVIAGIVYADHFSAEAAVWISFRGRFRQAPSHGFSFNVLLSSFKSAFRQRGRHSGSFGSTIRRGVKRSVACGPMAG
jgi:hypothetical protein